MPLITPGGKPVIDVPGVNATLSSTSESPVFVIVEAAKISIGLRQMHTHVSLTGGADPDEDADEEVNSIEELEICDDGLNAAEDELIIFEDELVTPLNDELDCSDDELGSLNDDDELNSIDEELNSLEELVTEFDELSNDADDELDRIEEELN